MKPIFLTMILLSLTLPAYADWSNTGMNPGQGPNFIPNQRQPVQHEVRVNAVPPRPVEHHTSPVVNHTQPVRHDQPVNHNQAAERHVDTPTYFRHDTDYYGHSRVIFPYSDVDSIYVVPDGYEAVVVDGQTYYYNEGVFYQQIGNQLVAIPPVIGAVVDSIPQDYQIFMADGAHYLFADGVFYQRVDQGFEVVQPPGTYQE